MFTWTPDLIRFMDDASVFSSYHQDLAKILAGYLPPDPSVCDMGCGLGHLSLALSPYCRTVTAVDRSEEALAVLRRNIRKGRIRNIEARCADAFAAVPPHPYDAMVFCFFGTTEEILSIAGAQCRGPVIAVRKNWTRHRFSAENRSPGRETYRLMAGRLDGLGIPYESREIELEMGQPFRSPGDALAFFRAYGRGGDASGVTGETVRKRLEERDDPVFPYYLPQRKRMGVLVFDAGDIPEPYALRRSCP